MWKLYDNNLKQEKRYVMSYIFLDGKTPTQCYKKMKKPTVTLRCVRDRYSSDIECFNAAILEIISRDSKFSNTLFFNFKFQFLFSPDAPLLSYQLSIFGILCKHVYITVLSWFYTQKLFINIISSFNNSGWGNIHQIATVITVI